MLVPLKARVGEWCGVLRRERGREGKRTSLRILTLPRMPSTCASFWLSSSLSTASLYWPLFHGVCVSACWVPLLYAASLSLHRPLLRAPLPTIQKSHLLPQKSSYSQPQQSVFTQRTQNCKSLPPIRRRTAILAHPTARRTEMRRRPASSSYTHAAAVAISAADRGTRRELSPVGRRVGTTAATAGVAFEEGAARVALVQV